VTGDVKPWGRWATLGLGLIALFGGQAAALTTLNWWYGLSLTQWSILAANGAAVTLSVCIANTVQVALLALMARQTRAGAAAYLGLTLPSKRNLLLGIVAVTIFIAAADGISTTLGHTLVTQFQLDIYRTASAAGWLPWLWLALVVVAPIGEEILFRGFLFRGWHRSPHDTWAVIIIIALLWSLMHLQYDLYFMGQVFVYGLVLGWFRWKSGSTILTMILHALVNFEGMLETVMAGHDQFLAHS
jgi:membrane protease YdiL (CAAX protease family)